MATWRDVEEQVHAAIQGHFEPFFRGHRSDRWELAPALGRNTPPTKIPLHENRLYYRFLTLGSHMLPESRTSWDTLYWMQHHGVPTRLLDWSESFAVAVFFAISGAPQDDSDAAVFIADTYTLNKKCSGYNALVYLNTAFDHDYAEYFVDSRSAHRGTFPHPVVAVVGPGHSTRMRSQRGVFTLHSDLSKPLETLCPAAITKVTIPRALFSDARRYLRLAGIDRFSLFPDLDGLASLLREELSSW